MDPKQTIKKNLERRSKSVDIVDLHDGVPKPTWVELSLIDVCNRKCVFCPKHDEDIAPDTYQSMSKSIIDKIHDQLKAMNFGGTISLCGYGEPLLHKEINYVVKKLSFLNIFRSCSKIGYTRDFTVFNHLSISITFFTVTV